MAVTSREADRRVDAFIDACRRDKISVTHQRIEILRELARTDEHPDAEMIYRRVRKRLSTVSLDTVYRTLALLEEKGFARRVDVGCSSARFDGNMQTHHHLFCEQCGRIDDFGASEFDGLAPPRQTKSWGDVNFVQVQFRGTCAACQATKGKKRRKPRR
jgi:Fur family transcriptional regulator, peroxide stress response regulator